MATRTYSDKVVSTGQPRWRLLGVDRRGVFYNVREPTGEVVGVYEDRIVARERPRDLDQFIDAVAREIGWADHEAARPRRSMWQGIRG